MTEKQIAKLTRRLVAAAWKMPDNPVAFFSKRGDSVFHFGEMGHIIPCKAGTGTQWEASLQFFGCHRAVIANVAPMDITIPALAHYPEAL
jgi:hypothetical protein